VVTDPLEYLKQAVPLRARIYIRERQREWHRARVWRRSARRLKRDPRGSDRLWSDLVYGWGRGWSAEPAYLEATAAAALAETGPILECGSGLTTIVLAAVARQTGSTVWTLEHDSYWLKVVESELGRLRLDVNMRLAPLRDYGGFDWYDVDSSALPTFSLVICDGPPGWTRGGRYGLLPVLGDRLAPGCAILLDDAARPGEQEVLRQWTSRVPLRYDIRGDEKPFATVKLNPGEVTSAAHDDERPTQRSF
jgi:hypothetical protein